MQASSWAWSRLVLLPAPPQPSAGFPTVRSRSACVCVDGVFESVRERRLNGACMCARSLAVWRPHSRARPPFLCLCLPWSENLEPSVPRAHHPPPRPPALPWPPSACVRSVAPACPHPLVMEGSWTQRLTRRTGAAGQHFRFKEQFVTAQWARARYHLFSFVARGKRVLLSSRTPSRSPAPAPRRGLGHGSWCWLSG
jgi:hypothetical protein